MQSETKPATIASELDRLMAAAQMVSHLATRPATAATLAGLSAAAGVVRASAARIVEATNQHPPG